MLTFRSPSDADLDQLCARMTDAAPTYRGHTAIDYRLDEWSRPLRSTTTWDEAKAALGRWGAHRGAGVKVRPGSPPVEGQTVALAIHLGVAHVLAACRVTMTVASDDTFGFGYATLPVHPEEGEETFILRRGSNGSVRFDITARSKPSDLTARLGGPVSRLLQRRITERYLNLDGLG